MSTDINTATDSSLGPVQASHHGTLYIWWVDLDEPTLPAADFYRMLSGDEQERADTMPQDLMRRYVCCRGLLRIILARHSGKEAASLVFAADIDSKPRLVDPPNAALSFNLAHNRNLAIIAVADGEDIGIDVEHRSRWQEIEENADAVFAPDEQALIDGLADRHRHAAIVRGWVRKEALLKASGDGLTVRLSDINVLADHSRSIHLPGSDDAWRLIDLQLPDPDWIAAIAVADLGGLIDVQLRHWADAHTP